MSSLGFQTILYGFASLQDVVAERVFLDDAGEELLLLDGAFKVHSADILAFSISGENDYLNVLKILSLAGLPLRAEERDGTHPLVVAGGIAVSLNPEPLAEFIDVAAVGEGEGMLAPLVEMSRERGSGGREREALLEGLADVEGLYIPSLMTPVYGEKGLLERVDHRGGVPKVVQRAWVRDLDSSPAVSRILAPGSEFENLFLVEVNRGCGRGCRFCAAGHLCRPLRHRTLDSLKSSIDEGAGAARRFGLLGSAVSDYPDFLDLARYIVEKGLHFSVSSLRIDRLNREFLGLLKAGGCRTVTLAPETGSERLRRAINKGIDDDVILEAVEETAAAGIPNVKLYFMVGLPTETADDREAIPALLRDIHRRFIAGSRSRKRVGRISVSLSCFVPKAWTPFQWHPFAEVKQLKGHLLALTREIRKMPNFRVSHDQPKWAYVQALFSRCDRRAAGYLERAHRLGGGWKKALAGASSDPDFFVSRQRGEREVFPWDFIDTGLNKEVLWKQYQRALS